MRAVVLAVVATLLALPGVAAAAPNTVINFESIPQNQAITTQYQSSGVTFGSAQSFGFPQPQYGCTAFGFAPGIAGTSAQIACRTGPSEFPTRFFGTAFEFATERREVSFTLSSRVASQDRALSADVRVYGIGGVLLEQRTVGLAAGANVPVSFSRANQEIAGIVISGELDPENSGAVLLDDIVATLDDVPPPPKWSLALATPNIEVVEGSTGEATLSVRRFNGSSGPVTLGVTGLPSGIAATEFVPNPVTGRDPVAMRVTADSPFAAQQQLTVTASGGGSAGNGVVTQQVLSVTGVPAAQIAAGGRSPIRLVPGCGAQLVDDSFTTRGGYTGTVFWSPRDPTGGLTASAATVGLANVGGDGVHPVQFSLDPGNADGGGSFEFSVRPTDATPASLRLNWLSDRVVVDTATVSVRRPFVVGTSTAVLVGNFPALRCAMTFQDGAGNQWTLRSRDQVEVDGRFRDRLVLNLPVNAVSGPLRILSPAGAELARTARIEVGDFRNTFGLSQGNSGAGAGVPSYTWEDFERVYGTDDTEDCFIFCVRDAIAEQHFAQLQASVTAFNGLCFGYSTMALRFRGSNGIEQRPSTYQPGVTRAWQIAPVTDGTAVKRDVVRWQTAQRDKSYSDSRVAGFARSAADERALLRELISRHGGAIVSFFQGNS